MFGLDRDSLADADAETGNDESIDVAELAERPPGADVEDPYGDVRTDTLPDWWQDAIEEFERHRMRTYQPPRFADGTPAYPVIVWLEHSLDVEIQLVGVDDTYEYERVVRVDGESVERVEHERKAAGFTVYQMSSSEFVEAVSEGGD